MVARSRTIRAMNRPQKRQLPNKHRKIHTTLGGDDTKIRKLQNAQFCKQESNMNVKSKLYNHTLFARTNAWGHFKKKKRNQLLWWLYNLWQHYFCLLARELRYYDSLIIILCETLNDEGWWILFENHCDSDSYEKYPNNRVCYFNISVQMNS